LDDVADDVRGQTGDGSQSRRGVQRLGDRRLQRGQVGAVGLVHLSGLHHDLLVAVTQQWTHRRGRRNLGALLAAVLHQPRLTVVEARQEDTIRTPDVDVLVKGADDDVELLGVDLAGVALIKVGQGGRRGQAPLLVVLLALG
jgi:hypothetical protein